MTALVVLGVSTTTVAMGRMTHGFIAYYTASRILISGELDARIYDDAWFMSAVQRVSGTEVKEIFGPNPPAMALLALPVVAFEPSVARAIWLTASLMAFAGATWFWLRRVPRHDLRGPVVIAIAMLNPAVWANLRQAQAYLFVFAALTWVARSSLIGRDTAGGLVAGLLVALKSSGLPWWALSVVERRWRFVAAAAASWLLLSGIVFAVTGLEPWLRYPRYVAEFVQRPARRPRRIKPPGASRGACASRIRSSIRPLPPTAGRPHSCCRRSWFCLPWLWTARRVIRGASPKVTIAAGVCLSLLALPVAEEHHFVLLTIPLFLALESHARQVWPRPLEPSVLAVAVAMLMVPLELTTPFTTGLSALLAYPRLYAAWLLWALAVQGRVDTYPS